MGMGVVVLELEILVSETENILDIRIKHHLRQSPWSSSQLQTCLFQMIEIEMRIACRMDEFSRFQTTHLCHHQQQQGIGCNVEGDTKEGVCAALVELQRQAAVGHIKLKEAMSGR